MAYNSLQYRREHNVRGEFQSHRFNLLLMDEKSIWLADDSKKVHLFIYMSKVTEKKKATHSSGNLEAEIVLMNPFVIFA